LTEKPAEPKTILTMLRMCNPTLPTADWRVAKVEEAEGLRRQVVLTLNEETVKALERTEHRLNQDEEISSFMASHEINWHFIPPSAPHFGGIWETGVRSIKLHLKRVIGSSALTFEEYSTLLIQIEGLLNSRPLCAPSDHSLNPLTPSHFLTGQPLTSVPEPSFLDVNINRLQRWRQLQAKVQGFWKRWNLEYLSTLQPRTKWHQDAPNVAVDTLVVLKEPNQPPSKWMLGRV
ncbi:hypothetical protein KR074_010393, partial [Drosophila pseudoananassae]